jgi:hypothetical protein
VALSSQVDLQDPYVGVRPKGRPQPQPLSLSLNAGDPCVCRVALTDTADTGISRSAPKGWCPRGRCGAGACELHTHRSQHHHPHISTDTPVTGGTHFALSFVNLLHAGRPKEREHKGVLFFDVSLHTPLGPSEFRRVVLRRRGTRAAAAGFGRRRGEGCAYR